MQLSFVADDFYSRVFIMDPHVGLIENNFYTVAVRLAVHGHYLLTRILPATRSLHACC